MNQIKCPHCGEIFTIDESNYDSIVKQIRDHEFEEELARREKEWINNKNLESELIKKELLTEKETALSNKDKEITTLKNDLENKEIAYKSLLQEKLAEQESINRQNMEDKNSEISNLSQEVERLKMQLNSAENEKNTAVTEVGLKKDKELSEALADSKVQIAHLNSQLQQALKDAQVELEKEKSSKENDVRLLQEQISNKETEKDLAVQKAISELSTEKTKEIVEWQQKYEQLRQETDLKLENVKSSYEDKITAKDSELAEKQTLLDYYKDLKTRMSTKMVGETLEQHCQTEFNRNRMGMFPKAYFEKDNDARSGSKGDFIFRDYDEDGKTEIISIMFEMKNESDTTASKHKNEDFFKELDKDRKEKNCEYAILVSLLEADNDLYNDGIVDVSYRYPKMYVIRPQFFIPIITLLRNAALNSADYKKQLLIERNNNLDITHFEENMENFKNQFSRNYKLAADKFNTAIDEIDKTISHLQKTRDALVGSQNNLRLANEKAQDLSIKKLTKNAPSVAQKFEELNKE